MRYNICSKYFSNLYIYRTIVKLTLNKFVIVFWFFVMNPLFQYLVSLLPDSKDLTKYTTSNVEIQLFYHHLWLLLVTTQLHISSKLVSSYWCSNISYLKGLLLYIINGMKQTSNRMGIWPIAYNTHIGSIDIMSECKSSTSCSD